MPAPHLPPGPRSSLTQLRYLRDPFPWMVKLAQEYADPVTVPILGMGDMVLTWSPEGVRTVFSADPDTFVPGTNEALALIVGRSSLFMMSGAAHRRARKLLMPPFHGERMRAYGALMHDTARRWAQGITPGVSAPVLPVTQGITLDIIIEAIFGERDPARISLLHKDILAIVAAFNPVIATFKFAQREFGGVGPWARFRRRAEALEARMRALMDEKRARPGDDILSLLLSVRDEDGAAMDDREVLEQLLTFVIAGHETTATSLAWALYELHRAPEALGRLREALANKRTPEEIAATPYLEAVVRETQRMHPPVPVVTRKLARPLTLGAFALPAGTTLGVGVFNAHHRAETFVEPFAFRPERFLTGAFSPFEYLPFGGGARRCVGWAFAEYEQKLALAALLDRGTYTLDEPAPVRNAFRIGTYGPETGVRLTLTARPHDG
ncbi:MAG: cytochrome P450 [Polyangiales bacterium]